MEDINVLTKQDVQHTELSAVVIDTSGRAHKAPTTVSSPKTGEASGDRH